MFEFNHSESSTSELSETAQNSEVTKASLPVEPVADITGDPLLAASEASASVPELEPVMTGQQENELTPVATDPQCSEIRSTTFLSNRVTTATYQDAIMYRNKVMARFEDRPEIYHKFLEILQRLHRLTQVKFTFCLVDSTEGGVIQGYKRALEAVEMLFENDTDLVQEFKQQFQPSCSGNSCASSSTLRDT
ncbi:unnamed protein product, partial [Brugia timori]|uniref:Uncharacterized protein n=1 Tax=Brugia timori TaxID=42155 RepID=A0A0R3QHH0_9BILA